MPPGSGRFDQCPQAGRDRARLPGPGHPGQTWLLVVLDAGLAVRELAAQYGIVWRSRRASGFPASSRPGCPGRGHGPARAASAIGLALAGKPSRSGRFLSWSVRAASAGMNFAAARRPRQLEVGGCLRRAAGVPGAVITDRVIAVIRQHVLLLDAESVCLGRGGTPPAALLGMAARCSCCTAAHGARARRRSRACAGWCSTPRPFPVNH